MAQHQSDGLPPDIEAVRERIENWRQTREKRTRMPEDLWQAAVTLASKHGKWRVARALGVRYDGLKLRMASPEANSNRVRPGFVDLTAVLGSGRREGQTTLVEVSRADGARLSLRLPSGGGDLQSLVLAFCQPAP